MNPLLSIVCPSYRSEFLDTRLHEQVRKAQFRNDVELLILHDNDWNSVGEKYRRLVRMARGTFIMGMGDDDILSPRLIPIFQKLVRKDTLGMSFDVLMLPDSGQERICVINPHHSFPTPEEALAGYWVNTTQYRAWWTVCPTHRSLFEDVDWDAPGMDSSWQEDFSLTRQLTPIVQDAGQRWIYCADSLYFAFPRLNHRAVQKTHPRYVP